MENLNVDSYLHPSDEDKNLQIKKMINKNLNKKFPNFDLYNTFIHDLIVAIDYKNIYDIEKLSNDINKNYHMDVIFELYNNKLLTSERLQFIMKNCTKYFNISSNLIKKLIKEDDNISFLDIIFSYLRFYDNKTILELLLHYKNKKKLSTLDLNQLFSNEKYKISIKDESL